MKEHRQKTINSMLNVFLATGDDIIIIDPEREYVF